MIQGFEKETCELTPEELNKIVPLLVCGYRHHIGKDNSISNMKVRSALEDKFGIKIADARFRKMINYIRTEGQVPCLIADNSGYFVAKDRDELFSYTKGLRARANEILKIADTLEVQSIDL